MEHIVNKSLFLIVVLGDFNASTQGWYQNNKTTFEGSKIDMATFQFSLSLIMKETTHILSNAASYIILIFTSQPNLVMHSGIHSSIHSGIRVVTIKLSLQNSPSQLFYPLPYKRLVWHYQQANTDFIKQVTELFNWEKNLSNLDVFKESIMNTFENYVPHETISCNDKYPPWMNQQTKKSLSNAHFSIEDIKNIISKPHSNNTHGDDMISIHMFELCDKLICKPLYIILKSFLTGGIFPSEWKKPNMVPILKKTTNSVLKTTGPSLFSQSVAKFSNV